MFISNTHMKKKISLIAILLFIAILIISAIYAKFHSPKHISSIDQNCTNNSWTISITTGQYGEISKICLLRNWAICDILEYYVGQCPTKESSEVTWNLSSLDGHWKSLYIAPLSIVINFPIAINEIQTNNSWTIYLAWIDADPRLSIKKINNSSLIQNIANKTCPIAHRECRFKTIWFNQILYMYGVNKSWFFDYNILIANSWIVFSLQDRWMDALIKKDLATNPKKFTSTSFKQQLKNEPPIIRPTIDDAIFYWHDFIDGIRNPRD